MNQFDTTVVQPAGLDIDVNPLDEVVNEKSYTSAGINAQGIDLNAPIPEPSFAPPPINQAPKEKTPPPKPDPMNPEMEFMSKKDTEMAAGHMAELILSGYEYVHVLGNKGLQVSERKLNKLQAQGEINLNAMIDYDYGKRMPAGEFFKEYNSQASNMLTVSDEFKDEVRPLLIKVLSKRGIGMTDEQMLVFLFGKDLATKTMLFFQQRGVLNNMIESIKAATTSQYAQQAPPPPPPPSTPEPESIKPEPQQPTYQEPEENQFSNVGQQAPPPPQGQPVKPQIIKRPAGRPRTKV